MASDHDDDAKIAADLMRSHYKTYFSASGLCINQDKCSIMIIRSRTMIREIICNGKPEEKKVKVGIYFDSRYKFVDETINVSVDV